MKLRAITRREVLKQGGKAGLAGAVMLALPAALARATSSTVLTGTQLATLRAAVARIVPASSPSDWSAADVGADSYILTLLSGTGSIYAGGPFRSRFARFQQLTRVKRIGWGNEVASLRTLYKAGIAQLDSMAGGNFAAVPTTLQDAILTELDDSGSDFFSALYNHTIEGVYSHPVYGGNRDYRAWNSFAYAGDVHGVRFPHIGPRDAPWNVYGGYAPEEMAQPGKGTS